jgi:hypothetical protein
MADQLPSGRWRGRVRDPRTGKQVIPHTIIGGAKTYPTRRAAERAEDDARDALYDLALRGKTVGEFWQEWTTDPLWARPAESTNLHYAERTRAFAEAYADRRWARSTRPSSPSGSRAGATSEPCRSCARCSTTRAARRRGCSSTPTRSPGWG